MASQRGKHLVPRWKHDPYGGAGWSLVERRDRCSHAGACFFKRLVTRLCVDVLTFLYPCSNHHNFLHLSLKQSVVDARMNTLRVWGGGIFEYDSFFDAADAHGVLLYHDMM